MDWKIKTGYFDKGGSHIERDIKKCFFKTAKDKKIYLFGCGDGIDYFLDHYGDKYYVEAIIDNDCKMQHTKYININKKNIREIVVIGIDDLPLDKKEIDQIFIVITSLRYYLEIETQLEMLGIEHFVSLVLMEKPQGLRDRTIALFLKGYISFYDWFATRVMYSTHRIQQQRTKYKFYMRNIIQKNKIVVYDNQMYDEHPKYLVEYILRYNIPIEIVWITRNLNSTFPKGIRVVYAQDKNQTMYELATAKIWISAFALPPYLIKRKEQIYIHTKHWSSITLKTFALDESSNVEGEVLYKWNGRNIDYFIVGSEFDERTCKSGYKTNAKFLRFGSARSDILFESDFKKKEEIGARLNLESESKVLLYAPTFRRKKLVTVEKSVDLYSTFIRELEGFSQIMKRKMGDNHVILLRLHPLFRKASKNMKLPEQVVDVSEYDDIQELILVSDMVITDYSSLMFEPMYIKKPVFLYATDKEEYIRNERDFLLDFNELPFSFAESMEELERNIVEFDETEYQQRIIAFMEKYGVCEDGQASKRTVDFICQLLDISY